MKNIYAIYQPYHLLGAINPASVRAWQVSGAVIMPSTANRSKIAFNSAN
jgi:hypothetical protein